MPETEAGWTASIEMEAGDDQRPCHGYDANDRDGYLGDDSLGKAEGEAGDPVEGEATTDNGLNIHVRHG